MPDKIKLGYLGIGFRRHSTGYLSKDIITHHDPALFETHYFHYEGGADDLTRDYFMRGGIYHNHHGDPAKTIAQAIREAGIQILVYLDAATRPGGIEIMCRQPAPIQISWLGGDHPGIPEIPYLFADRHLLPDPYGPTPLYLSSYCAVGSLDASADFDMVEFQSAMGVGDTAQLLWTAGPGFKRSDEIIEAHCRILQETSQTFLIVKGIADMDLLIQRYRRFSDPKEVSHRLRFLPIAASEEIHRRQMSVADVFLDTYPYNASTHAVEALALGIPVVTWPTTNYFGRQAFSLVSSCGLQDDLVATDLEDYVEIAVNICEDPDLYERVRRKILGSHYTSPLFQPNLIRKEMEGHYLNLIKEF